MVVLLPGVLIGEAVVVTEDEVSGGSEIVVVVVTSGVDEGTTVSDEEDWPLSVTLGAVVVSWPLTGSRAKRAQSARALVREGMFGGS